MQGAHLPPSNARCFRHPFTPTRKPIPPPIPTNAKELSAPSIPANTEDLLRPVTRRPSGAIRPRVFPPANLCCASVPSPADRLGRLVGGRVHGVVSQVSVFLFCPDAIVLFGQAGSVLVGRTSSIRVISCRRSYPLPHIPEGYSVRRRQPLEAPREGVTPPATNNADRGAPARQGAGSYPAPTSAVPSRQKRDCRHLSDSLMVQVL